MSRRLLFVLVVIGALDAALAWRLAAPATVQQSGPILLLSGRDDHGLLQYHEVPLQRDPADSSTVALLHDGSFVRVVEQRGDWLLVQSVAAPEISGWVNDYVLRNRALRSDGAGQVTFVDAALRDGQVMIAVRPVDAPQAEPIWLPAATLKEVGARDEEEHTHHER